MTASPASLRLIGALNKSGEPGAKSRAPDNRMLGTKQQQGNSYDHDPPQIIGWIHQYMPHFFAGGGHTGYSVVLIGLKCTLLFS